jgi:hypothetical protein
MVAIVRDCSAVAAYVERLSGVASEKIGEAERKRTGLLEALADADLTLSIWKRHMGLYQKYVSTKS